MVGLGLEGLSTDYVMPSKPSCVTGHYNLLTYMYVCMYVRMSDTLLETLVMLKCNSCVNCVRFVEGRRQTGELYWMLICISALMH